MSNKNLIDESHRDLLKQLYEKRFINPQISQNPFQKVIRIQKKMKMQRSPKHNQLVTNKPSKSFSYVGPIFINEDQSNEQVHIKPFLKYTQQSADENDEGLILREKPQTANIRINSQRVSQKANFLRAQKFSFNPEKGQRIFHIMKMAKQSTTEKKQILNSCRTLVSRKVIIGGLDLEKQSIAYQKMSQTLDCHFNLSKQLHKKKLEKQNQQRENQNKIIGMDIRRKIKSQKQARVKRLSSINNTKQVTKIKRIVTFRNAVAQCTLDDQLELNPWAVDSQF